MAAVLSSPQQTHELVEEALTNLRNQVPGAAERLTQLKSQGMAPDTEQAARFMNQAWVGFMNHKEGSQDFLKALTNVGVEVPLDRASYGLKKELEIFQSGGYKDPALSTQRLAFLAEIKIGPQMQEFDIAMRGALRDIRDKEPDAHANYEFLKGLGGKISPEVGEYAMKNALRDLRDGEPGAKALVSFLQKEGAVASPETTSHYLLLAAKDYANADKPDASVMQTIKDLGGKLGPNEASKVATLAAHEIMSGEPTGTTKLNTLYAMDIKMDKPAEEGFLNRALSRLRQGIEGAIGTVNTFMDLGMKVGQKAESGNKAESSSGLDLSEKSSQESAKKISSGLSAPEALAGRFSSLFAQPQEKKPSAGPRI